MSEYTLTTKSGKVMQFYIKTVAELYQKIVGGVVTEQQHQTKLPNLKPDKPDFKI